MFKFFRIQLSKSTDDKILFTFKEKTVVLENSMKINSLKFVSNFFFFQNHENLNRPISRFFQQKIGEFYKKHGFCVKSVDTIS
jgi:hypothetical protein